MQTLLEYNRKDLRNWAGEELAKQFFDNRSKYPAPYNNLDYWISKSTPEALKDYISSYKSKNQQKRDEMQEGAEKIYDDGRWLVVLCKTYDAMKYYGKGTKWCIAGNFPGHEGRGAKYFNSYKNSRYIDYYVYIDREGKEGNNKWCVCPYQENSLECDIWNAPDNTVSAISGAPTIKGLPYVSDIIIDGDTLVEVKRSQANVLEIPPTVKHIGRKAMYDCQASMYLIPNTVESIGSGAFSSSGVTKIQIPDSVKTVGTALFLMCDYLREAELGTGIKTLTKNMFAFCDGEVKIHIDGVIDSIDDTWLEGTDATVFFHEKGNEKLLEWLKHNKIKGVSEDTFEILTDR